MLCGHFVVVGSCMAGSADDIMRCSYTRPSTMLLALGCSHGEHGCHLGVCVHMRAGQQLTHDDACGQRSSLLFAVALHDVCGHHITTHPLTGCVCQSGDTHAGHGQGTGLPLTPFDRRGSLNMSHLVCGQGTVGISVL